MVDRPDSRLTVRRAQPTLLALIVAVAAALRLYGLDWDGGQWLHPDERQIYFVVNRLAWPAGLAQALSPGSPLNPGFFAYGSLPLYLLRLVAAAVGPLSPALRDPGNLHLVGRPLSVLFDLGTVLLTYRLARRLWPHDRWSALFAAALAGVAVLPIQLAHFYTADTLLTLLVMLVLNLAAAVAGGAGRRTQAALGVALGLALAAKLTAFPLVLVVLLAFTHIPGVEASSRTVRAALCAALALAVFCLAQPYALIDAPTFLADTLLESKIAWGRLDVPYTRQFAGTLPYLYSMWQTAVWGLGLPLGVAAWAGFGLALIRWLRRGVWAEALILAWAGPYLAFAGLLHARYLRYMLPLIPVLCLLAARCLAGPEEDISSAQRRAPSAAGCPQPALPAARPALLALVRWALLVASLAYALAYVGLYARPHSWITASEWVYRSLPAGSTLAVEDWDTALPLPLELDGRSRRIEEYNVRTLKLYAEPDDGAKWATLAEELSASDYVVVASRRVYGSVARLPGRYPRTTAYYERLMAGDLGFQLAAEFTRGPAWLNPRLAPLPNAAPALFRPDESFVVYDHPRVLVYYNVGRLSAAELLRRLEIDG